MVAMIYFNDQHFMAAFGTSEGIIAKREKDVIAPQRKTLHDMVFGRMDCFAQGAVGFPMPCIKAVIAGHFKLFFRDMLDQEFDKIDGRKFFFDIGIITMTVIVENDIFTIIGINTLKGNDGSSQIPADVFYNGSGITEVGLCEDIKTVFVFAVNAGFGFLEGWADTFFHLIKESSLESLAEELIRKMSDITPETVVGETAFGDQAVDMWIPFQGAPEGMEDADETGNKVFSLVHLRKHTKDNTADSLEKAVEEGTVFEKEVSEIFINGKDTVAVSAGDEFEGHVCGAFLTVFHSTGRAKSGMAAERDKLKASAVGACIHGSAERGVPAVDHLGDVFHFNVSGMQGVLNDFVVVFKNLL